MNKELLGFEDYVTRSGVRLADGALVARVIAEHKTEYAIVDAEELVAVVRGSFHRDEEFPKVGDWVTYSPTEGGGAVIETLLPRLAVIARKEVGSDKRQVIATNVDRMLVVQGLDGDFNLRRIERYLILARQSGCEPVIILTKSDVAKDAQASVAQVLEVAPGTRVHAISVTTGVGIETVRELLAPGRTAVLVGSSGAGKSTILNALLGSDAMRTQEVRADDSRGRHTTTHRELFVVPGGGLVIDTPGMRELGILPTDDSANEEIFAKVSDIILDCRYPDCDHEKSAGCAVQAAIADGTLDAKQFVAYHRILRDQAAALAKVSADAERERLAAMHKLTKGVRKVMNDKRARHETEPE